MARIVRHGRQCLVQIELDPDEAENIAYALGLHDEGAKELLALASQAREFAEGDGRG